MHHYENMWKGSYNSISKKFFTFSKYGKTFTPLWRQGQKNAHSTKNQNMDQCWGYYKSPLGPDKWHNLFPAGCGYKQSPIDIKINRDPSLSERKIVMNYNPLDIAYVVNSGHSVTFVAEGDSSVINGGPLVQDHTLLQFHFHWGSIDSKGSEHTLNGKQYAAEIHLVHLNTKYSTFHEALGHADGLCVIGAFLEVADVENPAYDKLARVLAKVQYKNEKYCLESGIDPLSLLPEDQTSFSFYEGSLTTPPLSECVQWINFLEPIQISKKNIAAFRNLCSNERGQEEEHIMDNHRPIQPIHGRTLCFHRHA